MQLELLFRPEPAQPPAVQTPEAGTPAVNLWFVRNRWARRYILRLQPDGTGRVTIPRGGTLAEARQFAARNAAWLERQLRNQASRPGAPGKWGIGTEVFYRGRSVRLEMGSPDSIRLEEHMIRVAPFEGDLRPAVERYLRRLAEDELPSRAKVLAALHHITIGRITIRGQKSRWGSCSRRGTISLNWRLVQTPEFVRDYIILHELAHVKEMNHSRRYWREVARLCPEFAVAEDWIKRHSRMLL